MDDFPFFALCIERGAPNRKGLVRTFGGEQITHAVPHECHRRSPSLARQHTTLYIVCRPGNTPRWKRDADPSPFLERHPGTNESWKIDSVPPERVPYAKIQTCAHNDKLDTHVLAQGDQLPGSG